MLGGVPIKTLRGMISHCGEGQANDYGTIVRAIPSIASLAAASMTVVEDTMPFYASQLVTALFTPLGRIKYLPTSLLDASTALCSSGRAYVASIIGSF